MPERFSVVADNDVVFRLVDENSTFLPAGIALPLPAWFNPGTNDIAEGAKRGRVPGFSMWNNTLATAADVKTLVNRTNALAFGLNAGTFRKIGKEHSRDLEVLADPADEFKPTVGWDAHSLVEGLQRPESLPRVQHKDMLTVLAAHCRSVESK